MTIDIFLAEPSLCIVKATRNYLAGSLPWRNHHGTIRDQLLPSYVAPHKPVVSCTIAGWLFRLLKEASTDTEQFRDHSTRGASTRVLQKVLSLGSDYFSYTFYQTYFITNLQSIHPLLKHIFVTFLPSRETQINRLFWYLLETLINSSAKRTSRRILISRKYFLKHWK